MPESFGLKIGLEGEKEFKNAIRDINQSFKVLGSEMNLISSQFDKNDRSVQALTTRNNLLNKEIDTQKDKIASLDKALQNDSRLDERKRPYLQDMRTRRLYLCWVPSINRIPRSGYVEHV